MSGRTMYAENHRLLLTSFPVYNSFLETTENYTLQIQRKYQVLLFITSESYVTKSHVAKSHVSESHASEFHVSVSYVSESYVPESYVPESHVPESHVPESHVPVPLLVTARI